MERMTLLEPNEDTPHVTEFVMSPTTSVTIRSPAALPSSNGCTTVPDERLLFLMELSVKPVHTALAGGAR